MEYALDRAEREVRAALAATGLAPAASLEVATPRPGIAADLAVPTFRAARELGLPPPRLAQDLAAAVHFSPETLVGRVEATGPFLNLTFDDARLAEAVLGEVERLGERYGHDDLGAGRTVLVEGPSPNMARRMHVGHVRSTVIGHALFLIMAALGYRAVSDNHIGDWGKNFGVLITAIRHEGRPTGAGEEPLARLEALYAQYNRLIEADPVIDQEARDWSLRLEQGDPEARELWRWIVELTLRLTQPVYDRLGVRFDTVHGESFYEDKMAPVIAEALARGVARPGEGGALVVDLPDLPTFVLRRGDGGTLYQTRDAATIVYREQAYRPSAIVYIVDARQELHFRQVYGLVRALGHARDIDLVHVGFGMVLGPDGQPLAARRGNMVYLQALLDEAHARARAVVERASGGLPAAEKEAIAEAVGIGAVIYNDLYQDPRRTITLDWDRMLALEGNSAPYIQYMHARCRSILRRAVGVEDAAAPATAVPGGEPGWLTHPAEATLVRCLAKLPLAVRQAGARYAPAVVAEWCHETARAVAGFYRDCPVLQAEGAELRAARLRLVGAAAQALRNGLALLGIAAPERM